MPLTDKQKGAIYGVILGDANEHQILKNTEMTLSLLKALKYPIYSRQKT